MESLSTPFTIQINGKPVAKANTNADDGNQAQFGSEAATFTLQDGRLISGDWILGRNLIEDMSMRPKKISWFKAGTENAKKLHVVTAQQESEGHRLKFGGGVLIAKEDGLYVDLFGGNDQSSVQYVE